MAHQVALRWVFGLVLAGLVLAGAHGAWAVARGGAGEGDLAFTITRNGAPIGSHVYRFDRQGRRVVVDIHTDIDFRLLWIPVYRFRHDSREIWDGDRLVRLVSRTDDNGDPVVLDVRTDGGVLKIGGAGGSAEVDPLAVPASLWNPVVVERDRLLDTINGAVLMPKSSYLGQEVLTIGGKQVTARRYRLSGDYSRDLWYDAADGSLVRVLFEARDGSAVEYVRRN